MNTKDRVTMIITVTMCSFLLLSLVGTFVLEYVGRETGAIWGKVFDLITVLAGAIVGYIAGERVASQQAVKQATDWDDPDLHTGA